MRYLIVLLLLTGCASIKDENHSPERKADYAECEKQTPGAEGFLLGFGFAHALKVNDCMSAKGWK